VSAGIGLAGTFLADFALKRQAARARWLSAAAWFRRDDASRDWSCREFV